MTIPTGVVYMSQIAAEFGTGLPFYLRDGRAQNLAGSGGGPNYFSQLRGKSAYTPMYGYSGYGFSSDTTSANAAYNLSATIGVSNVQGGSGGYTYNWVQTGGTAPQSTSGQGTAGFTAVYRIARFGSNFNSDWRCDITDNTGHTVSVYCNINIYNNQ